MPSWITGLLRDDNGATAIEYALVAGLISIVIVAALTLSGTSLKSIFNTVATSI